MDEKQGPTPTQGMDRSVVLAQLLEQRRPLPSVLDALDKCEPWGDEDLVLLTRAHLSTAINRHVRGEQSFEDLIAWAGEVEMIDDIGREVGHEPEVSQILFEMATPELDGREPEARVTAWRASLSDQDHSPHRSARSRYTAALTGVGVMDAAPSHDSRWIRLRDLLLGLSVIVVPNLLLWRALPRWGFWLACALSGAAGAFWVRLAIYRRADERQGDA